MSQLGGRSLLHRVCAATQENSRTTKVGQLSEASLSFDTILIRFFRNAQTNDEKNRSIPFIPSRNDDKTSIVSFVIIISDWTQCRGRTASGRVTHRASCVSGRR